MSQKEKSKEDTLFLYVLLERISDLRDYNSNEGDQGDNGDETNWMSLPQIKNAYYSYFAENGADPENMSRYWLSKLTDKDVLESEITLELRNRDRAYGCKTEKIPQQTPYKLNGETLLHFAIRIPFKKGDYIADALTEIIIHLIDTCPHLIESTYNGLTPLQLAVVKGIKKIVNAMVKMIDTQGLGLTYPNKTLPAYEGTKMMAATPLALAAVSDHGVIFDRLITSEVGARTIQDTNESGDNIYHSLIRHAHREKSEKAEDVALHWFKKISNGWLENLQKKSTYLENKPNQISIRKRLWMMTNDEKLNPLQLAAKLGQYKLFEYIMKTNVYLRLESSDGLIDEEMYDITEIETLPIDYHVKISDETTDQQNKPNDIKQKGEYTLDIQRDYHTSVLEYIGNHDARTSFQFICLPPLKGVLWGKWKKYKWVCFIWFVLHVLFMGFLSYTAVAKRSVLYDSAYQNGSTSTPGPADFVYTFSNDVTIRISTICNVLIGFVYLAIECVCLLRRRFRATMTRNTIKNVVKQFKNPYSNMMFRVSFFVFSLTLFVDSLFVFFKTRGYENYLTPFSLIIGWYLVLFFLQVWKPFSFFTVLIQKVIIDLIKFAVVMVFILIAFSAAMFMVMQGAQHIDEDFTSFRRTAMKMLMVMVGLGDLDILFTARSTLMAVIVFVLFVLLTTILLLNALIALMSNTCTELMADKGNIIASKFHCYLQKLSMILYLESFFISKFIVVVGEIKNTPNRLDQNGKWVMQKRRKWMKKTLSQDEKSFGLVDGKMPSRSTRKKRSGKSSRRRVTDGVFPGTAIYTLPALSTYTPTSAYVSRWEAVQSRSTGCQVGESTQ